MFLIMRKIQVITALFFLAVSVAGAVVPQNKKPLVHGGNGVGLFSFAGIYNSLPVGSASVTGSTYPDFFVTCEGGMPQQKGLWICSPDGVTEDGKIIYKQGKRVENPFAALKKSLPLCTKVFQDGSDVLLVNLNKTELSVAKWDGESFVLQCKRTLSLTGDVVDVDFVRRSRKSLEMVMLVDNGAGAYRPDDPKYCSVSYYDGNQIYRGVLSRGGLSRINLDNDWNQCGNQEMITSDYDVIQGPVRVAVVTSSDDSLNGYILAGSLGSLKYVPYFKNIPAGGAPVSHLTDAAGSVVKHGAYSNRAVSYSIGKDRSHLLIGGESAMYLYDLSVVDGRVISNEPNCVYRRKAALYGGSLTVPNVVDWNGDGVLDIVAGNSEGKLLFFKNEGTDREPEFVLPEYVNAGGEPICLRPGYHIVQGPYEGAWGYLCPTVVDWNGDGLLDVVVSGSRQKYEVMINEGTPVEPQLAAPKTIFHDAMELHGTWRVRPAIATVDGVTYIMIMDDDDALHLYSRVDDTNVEDLGIVHLVDGKRITGYNKVECGRGQPGRGKLRLYDWDGDGDLDLFVGSIKRSSYPSPEDGLPYRRFLKKENGLQVMYFENVGKDVHGKAGLGMFAYPKQLQIDGEDFYLGAHSNAPEPCMLGDTSKGANLIVGCEQGRYFFFEREHITYIE